MPAVSGTGVPCFLASSIFPSVTPADCLAPLDGLPVLLFLLDTASYRNEMSLQMKQEKDTHTQFHYACFLGDKIHKYKHCPFIIRDCFHKKYQTAYIDNFCILSRQIYQIYSLLTFHKNVCVKLNHGSNVQIQQRL